jgi:diguanylate cyclase (GGDEF)-like protein
MRAAAFGAVIVCALLLLQYAHRRRPFILLWAAGWLLIAPSMLLQAYRYSTPRLEEAASGLSEFLAICTATLYLSSADVFRQTRYVRPARLKLLFIVAAWFVVAPIVLGRASVFIPGHLIQATLLALAASMYVAVLLERRLLGAGLVAFVLLGLAMANLTSAVTMARATRQLPFEILVLNGVLYTLGALGIHLLVFEDMNYELRMANRRLEAAREELMQAAITDPLTGCHNRRFLGQVIDRELQRHKRFELPLSLLFIDVNVNRFKAVNDSLGHEAGDRVLQYVARFLKRHIREADYIFRWGGDEFLVLITCRGSEAQRKVAVLKATFDSAPEAVELPPGIGLSIGWTEVPHGTSDINPLVREADERMYQDKGIVVSRGRTAAGTDAPRASARPSPKRSPR